MVLLGIFPYLGIDLLVCFHVILWTDVCIHLVEICAVRCSLPVNASPQEADELLLLMHWILYIRPTCPITTRIFLSCANLWNDWKKLFHILSMHLLIFTFKNNPEFLIP